MFSTSSQNLDSELAHLINSIQQERLSIKTIPHPAPLPNLDPANPDKISLDSDLIDERVTESIFKF